MNISKLSKETGKTIKELKEIVNVHHFKELTDNELALLGSEAKNETTKGVVKSVQSPKPIKSGRTAQQIIAFGE